MKKFLLFSSLLMMIGMQNIKAQLLAGDIAIIGYNTDQYSASVNDDFTFITLTDIPEGELIYFTDAGWWNTSWNNGAEGHFSWTAPAGGVSCGTIIHIYETSIPDVLATNIGSVSSLLLGVSGWNLSSSGDQVLIYQNSSGPGLPTGNTLITAIHGSSLPGCQDPTNFWTLSSCMSTGNALSTLPSGLTNGVNCISLFPNDGLELDNAKYIGPLTGDANTLRALINNPSNWSFDNNVPFEISSGVYSPSVFCVPPCTDPDVPTLSATPGSICPSASSTITITGNLNDATAWHIYTGSCGGTAIGTTATGSFVVSPSTTTTYYIRGEGGCVTPGSCGTVTVLVGDATNPSITCPGNQSLIANASCQASLPDYTGLATASDNCTASPTVTQLPAPGTTINGTTIVTLTATDGSSNTANCTFSVSLVDNINPVVTCPGTQTETPDGSCQFTLPDYTGLATVTDNCDPSPSITQLPAPGTTISGNTTVTLTGTDASNNSGSCTFNVILNDVTPPVITCADADTLYADANSCGAASSFVNVYYIPLADISADGAGGPGCNASLDVYSCGSDMTITWNSIETNAPISVDVEFYQSYYSEGANSPTTFNGIPNNDYVSADFNCSNQIINYSLNTTGYNVGGINALTITPSTNCIVLDVNPDLSWTPQSYAKVTVTTGGGYTFATPIVTDNCLVDTVYNDAPSILPVGTTDVTWTAEDANGNSSTCVQQVVVIDTLAPMINCPSDITLAADNGTCGFDASTSFENVYYISLADISSEGVNGPDCNGTGNDAYSCDSIELSISWNSLETINPSNVQVEFYQSYYNVGGNSFTQFNGVPNNDYVSLDNSCLSQIINYTLDPTGYIVGGLNSITIIPPTNCIVLDENPNPMWAPQSYAKVTVSYGIGSATASDNCAIDTIYNDAPSILPLGITTVTWTAVDVNGNSNTCTQQVTVNDLEAPMAVCQNINAYLDGSGMVIIPDNAIDGGSTDNCAGALTYNAQLVTFTCNELGANTDTLTVMDAAGNTATCVATVTVIDTISPTVVCPSDITVCVGETVNYSTPSGNDNCSQTVSQTDATGLSSGMVFPSGVTTLEYTSTDGSGNTAVCSFTVTVTNIDNTVDNSLMPTLSANQAGATYRWLDCDNGNAVIPSETGQSFTATANGNYAVEITIGNCSDTSACESVTGVGVREMNNQVVSIYPNPTNGMITLDLGMNNSIVNYTVVTIEGRIVEQGRTAENKVMIDLSGESKGVYFLQLKDETTSTVYKVLKQ